LNPAELARVWHFGRRHRAPTAVRAIMCEYESDRLLSTRAQVDRQGRG
jgi:hypothetical protein